MPLRAALERLFNSFTRLNVVALVAGLLPGLFALLFPKMGSTSLRLTVAPIGMTVGLVLLLGHRLISAMRGQDVVGMAQLGPTINPTATPMLRAVAVYIGLAVLTLAGTIATFARTLPALQDQRLVTAEITLTILLVAGIIALIVCLVLTVAVFRTLNLEDTDSPLGLPEGSVQAFIALSLILIFAIMAVFLYAQLRDDPVDRLEQVRARELRQIPLSDIVSRTPNPERPGTFDGVRRGVRSQSSDDFAKQIGTTVSMLVLAVSSFYFRGAHRLYTEKRAKTSFAKRFATVMSASPSLKTGERHFGLRQNRSRTIQTRGEKLCQGYWSN